MVKLKADLLNELKNQLYYAELELLRLAQDPNMKYRDKIMAIDEQLGEIALITSKIGFANQYFQEPESEVAPPVSEPAPVAPAVPEAPVAQAQPGQSHGE